MHLSEMQDRKNCLNRFENGSKSSRIKRHLDGVTQIVCVTKVLRTLSILFSSRGEHHNYYLNKHCAFRLFATERQITT